MNLGAILATSAGAFIAAGLIAVCVISTLSGKSDSAPTVTEAPTLAAAPEPAIAEPPPIASPPEVEPIEQAPELTQEDMAKADVARFVLRGRQYCDAERVDHDYFEAFRLFQQAAELGSADGWYYMGILADSRKGVSPDERRNAGTYLENAARLGHIDAAFLRGCIILEDYRAEYARQQGHNSTRDDERKSLVHDQARPWFEMAAAGGSSGAMSELGKMDRDCELCERAAGMGNLNAIFYVAKCMYYGRSGWEKDRDGGRFLLMKAADAGSAEAQEELMKIGAR